MNFSARPVEVGRGPAGRGLAGHGCARHGESIHTVRANVIALNFLIVNRQKTHLSQAIATSGTGSVMGEEARTITIFPAMRGRSRRGPASQGTARHGPAKQGKAKTGARRVNAQ